MQAITVWVVWWKKKWWQTHMHVDTPTHPPQVILSWELWQTSGTGCESRCRIEKNSCMLTGEDFNCFDTYEMKWNHFRGDVCSWEKSRAVSELKCQPNTRNRPFFNAERSQGSASRPSERRGGLLRVSAMTFWGEMEQKWGEWGDFHDLKWNIA